jgi:hypothetical protein
LALANVEPLAEIVGRGMASPHDLVGDSAEYGGDVRERGVQAYTDTPFVINGLRVSCAYPCKSYATDKQRHGTASKF